ncbi:MAG: hypothetical protein QG673_867 [Pseudomonadota bacterium]|nr:hypothetical protein [Pseudomonadota bacterium]
MADLIELKVPDIGGSTDVNVAEVYVKVGDTVQIDDNLIMLETDKASMDVPAVVAGKITQILVKVGDKLNEGDVVAKIEVVADKAVLDSNNQDTLKDKNVSQDVSSKREDSKTENSASRNSEIRKDEIISDNSVNDGDINEESFSKAFASPSIRKLARELGVDLGAVAGSGSKGRVTESDVKLFVKGVMTSGGLGNIMTSGLNNAASSSGAGYIGGGLDILPWPKIDFSKFGEVEVKERLRIKKISGANLLRNWIMIPHVTQFDEADITNLEEFRKQLNEEYKKDSVKLSPLAFLIKACVFALKQFPEFNSSIDGDNIIYKKYFNIGFAADTPQGLVVPVLKNADKKGIVEIAKESSELARLARDGKLKPTDMQGGSFTISSLGGIGGTAFTPIVNAPEVAILGISKSSIKPMWDGAEFKPRLMMPLSLSYDHRIIDGALAAKFTTYLAVVLSDVRRLIL